MWYLENINAYLLGKIYFMKCIIKKIILLQSFQAARMILPNWFFWKQNIFPIKTAKNNLKNFSSFFSSKEIEFVVPPTVSQSVASASYLGPTPVGSRWDSCGLVCGIRGRRGIPPPPWQSKKKPLPLLGKDFMYLCTEGGQKFENMFKTQ